MKKAAASVTTTVVRAIDCTDMPATGLREETEKEAVGVPWGMRLLSLDTTA
jgi:hypothetical protein